MSTKNKYHILSTPGWSDYALLDSGNGERLERFGKYTLRRPDPQAIWEQTLPQSQWQSADAYFQRIKQDQGKWIFRSRMPEKWLISWNNLSFWVKLTPFKHTGVFPEQAVQWEWMRQIIRETTMYEQFQKTQQVRNSDNQLLRQSENTDSLNSPNILNLFGYTGIATLACAAVGAKVTHVDASKPAITWARENQKASGLDEKPIRWIPDDVLKFVQREIKRGTKYDGIIMDPPIFGHGPTGQTWKFHEHFPQLLESCVKLLSDRPLFILINAYAISSSALMLENVLNDYVKHLGGNIEVGELALQEKHAKRLLSTGIFARWSSKNPIVY